MRLLIEGMNVEVRGGGSAFLFTRTGDGADESVFDCFETAVRTRYNGVMQGEADEGDGRWEIRVLSGETSDIIAACQDAGMEVTQVT